MKQTDFTYAVARIRSKELGLLSAQNLEQLISARSADDALRLLADKGWGAPDEPLEAEAMLAGEKNRAWQTVGEMVEDMSIFDVLRIPDDFHNLKAAIKQLYTNATLAPERLYVRNGRLDPETVRKCVAGKDFAQLPGRMNEAGAKAYETLVQTGDGQLCDVILDRAALEDMLEAGKASGSEVLAEYALMTAVSANVRIAARCARTGKSLEFVRRALAPCESLDVEALAHASVGGMGAVAEYLTGTDYADGAVALQESPAAFERWCDNLIMRRLQPQKYNPFTVGPLAAYLLARENEIKCVRMVLTGKLNGMPEGTIRERLREMYV